jgi:hypothetical protein
VGYSRPSYQGAEDHGRGSRVVEGGVGGRDVKLQLLHEAGQARSLAFGEIEHQPRQRRCVDDRVLERALQTPPHQPGVEGIVAVLDENGALSEA